MVCLFDVASHSVVSGWVRNAARENECRVHNIEMIARHQFSIVDIGTIGTADVSFNGRCWLCYSLSGCVPFLVSSE